MVSEKQELASAILTHPARCGAVRVVAIDGFAGAGKSTLAQSLEQSLRQRNIAVSTIHMDEMYNGWGDALTSRTWQRIMYEILLPLKSARFSDYSIFDWHTHQRIMKQMPEIPDLLLLEGVGSAAEALRSFLSAIIWIEVNPLIGLQRAIARDGEQIVIPMQGFLREQSDYVQREAPHGVADYRVSGAPEEAGPSSPL